MAASQTSSMEAMMVAMRQSMTDITTDIVSIRTVVAQTQTGLANLTSTSNTAWDDQSKKIDNLQSQIDDLQAQLRRTGGRDNPGQMHWHLEHKGALKTYDGTKKDYKTWAKQVMAFCNTKQAGFRKALKWAEQSQAPIGAVELAATQWEHIDAANQKLYDLLIQITSDQALLKVETTPGEDQGFESWRRIARQYDPSSRLTKIDRLNAITMTQQSSSIKELLSKIETWEQKWTKYELDHNETLNKDLKLGALMKMLPEKERSVVKLKYVEDEASLTYEVLRRQVEYWLESANSNPTPMDIGNLQQDKLKDLTEQQLEEALDVLRTGGKNRDGPARGGRQVKGADRGRVAVRSNSPRGGRSSSPNTRGAATPRKIKGKCWNCGREGHTAAKCRGPKKDANSMEDGDKSEASDCEHEQDLKGMGLGSFGADDDSDDGSNFGYDSESEYDDDLDEFVDCIDCDLSSGRPVGCPPAADEPGLAKRPAAVEEINYKYDLDLNPFSEIDDGSSVDGGDEKSDTDRPGLIHAIEEQLKSIKVIKAQTDGEEKEEEWQEPRRPLRGAKTIRGTPLPLTEAFLNPFGAPH